MTLFPKVPSIIRNKHVGLVLICLSGVELLDKVLRGANKAGEVLVDLRGQVALHLCLRTAGHESRVGGMLRKSRQLSHAHLCVCPLQHFHGLLDVLASILALVQSTGFSELIYEDEQSFIVALDLREMGQIRLCWMEEQGNGAHGCDVSPSRLSEK